MNSGQIIQRYRLLGRWRSAWGYAAIAVASLACPGVASAGILTSNNLTGLIAGSTEVDGSLIPSLGSIDAEVEWSVFEPGAGFQTFLGDNGIALSESFSATNYTYAYQVFNEGSASEDLDFGTGTVIIPGGPLGLELTTVGIDMGDVVVPGSVGSVETAVGDVVSSAADFAGDTPDGVTSAVWDFGGGEPIPVGGQSGLLFFASPNPPEFDSVNVSSGAVSFTSFDSPGSAPPSGPGVPSPGIPEPGTLSLLAVATALGGSRRKRR